MASVSNIDVVRGIWRLLITSERRAAVILVLFMIIGMVLETVGVGMAIPAIMLFTKSPESDVAQTYPVLQTTIHFFDNPSQESLVVGGMLTLVVIYVFKAAFLAFLAWRQSHFAFDVQVELSQRLFAIYLRQPYTFHLQRNSAQLIRNVISEVGVFTGYTILPSLALITEALVLLGLCGLLGYVEPLGAMIVMAVMGISAFGFYRTTRGHLERWGTARQHHDGMRIQHLQQGLGGAKDVKLLGREADFLEQYREHTEKSARIAGLQSTLQQLPRLWLEVLAVSGLALLVISLLAQGRTLEKILPTLGLFAAAAFRLMPSVNRVLNAVQSLRYGLPVVNILKEEVGLASREIRYDNNTHETFRTTIELRNISYSYPLAEEPTLHNVSLSIMRGTSVGFIGQSGAGKSTLVDILLGLLTPDEGEVLVDGKNVQGNLRNWQDQIGYVPQSIFLTDDTLRRNVAFGLAEREIDDQAVDAAIAAAQLSEFVASLPEGVNTIVGERGVRLSGGQRQRIGMARALYHRPSVLVLDEATSALDRNTEYEVMKAVNELQASPEQRKTVIIVAHRLTTVATCEKIYRISQGRLVSDPEPQRGGAMVNGTLSSETP